MSKSNSKVMMLLSLAMIVSFFLPWWITTDDTYHGWMNGWQRAGNLSTNYFIQFDSRGGLYDVYRPAMPMLYFVLASSIGCLALGFLAERGKVHFVNSATLIFFLALANLLVVGYVVYKDQFPSLIMARLPLFYRTTVGVYAALFLNLALILLSIHNMMKVKKAFPLVILALAIGLSSCNPATPAATATFTASPSPSPSPLPPTLTPTSTPTPIPTSTAKPLVTLVPSEEEQEAWQNIACMDVEAIRKFVEAFPDGTYGNDARLYLALFAKIDAIRSGEQAPGFVIPFEQLGERWVNWSERMPEVGAVGIYAEVFSGGVIAGVFFALPGCRVVSFDDGNPIAPTGDGSMLTFKTNEVKYHYLNDIIFESYGQEILYFAVIEGQGLVHLHGWGKVTMPDGTEVELK